MVSLSLRDVRSRGVEKRFTMVPARSSPTFTDRDFPIGDAYYWDANMIKVLSIAFLSMIVSLTSVVEGAAITDESGRQNISPSSGPKLPVHQEVPFGEPVNPDRCKNGKGRKGYIYWAAGDQTFAFRFNAAIPLYPRIGNPLMMPDEFIPPAPEPSEPEGCYGNPLRGSGVPYMWDYSVTTFEKLMGRTLLVADSRTHVQLAIQDRQHLRDDPNEFNRKQFLKGKSCRTRAPGITECSIDTGRPKQYSTQLLRIQSDLLFDGQKDGRDIYVMIQSDNGYALYLEKVGKELQSTIDLYGAVRIRDNFRIRQDEFDRLVPYYRAMINYIVDARVTDYSWNSKNTHKE